MRERDAIRLVVLTGGLWAAIWAGTAIVVLALATVIDAAVLAGEDPVAIVPAVGLSGLVGGMLFGLFIVVFERGRTLGTVSVLHALAWGAVAGLALPFLALTTADPSNTVALGVLAALITVGLARVLRPAPPEPAA